ncbi:MAG: AAA family ATPase [Nitrospirae bacterium]|nr:AAA family ATPase [Nitrospirota bacterium]
MSVTDLLSRLNVPAFYQALLPSLKINGKAESQASCPFHDDRTPSFSVNIVTGLWNCLAGCGGGDVFGFYQRLKGVDFPTAIREIADLQGIEEGKPQVTATFTYRDKEGGVLYRKERLEPGRNGRPKEFRFSHQEAGRWVSGRGGDPVLYNLPDVLQSKHAFIVEGEGKADLLGQWGLTATCLDSGASSPWRAEYLRAFEGKERVIVLPDNDAPGRSHALKVAEALSGHVGEIKMVNLPELQEKEDVIDWSQREGNGKARLLELVKASPSWTPEVVEIPGVVRLETVEPESVSWLWPGRIPVGKITLLDGDPGLGKSTVTLDLAARVSTGAPMPDGTPGVAGGVVILTLEDGLADTVVPRLKAVGADLSRIVALAGVPDHEGKLRLPTLENIEAMVRACRMVDAGLVIVDPLMGYLSGRTDSHRDQDIRAALGPLARMAEEIGVAVLVVRHLNKAGGGQSIYRGGGSIGIIGAARSALLVAKDPQDENRRVLAGIKNNLAPMPESMAFHIEGTDGGSRIVWEGATSHTADQLLSIPVSQEERSAVEDAQVFLRDLLEGGPVIAKEIQKQARGAGIAEKTLQRAKKTLGVVSKKLDSSFTEKGGWSWELPQDGQNVPKVVTKNNDHLGRNLTTLGEEGPHASPPEDGLQPPKTTPMVWREPEKSKEIVVQMEVDR